MLRLQFATAISKDFIHHKIQIKIKLNSDLFPFTWQVVTGASHTLKSRSPHFEVRVLHPHCLEKKENTAVSICRLQTPKVKSKCFYFDAQVHLAWTRDEIETVQGDHKNKNSFTFRSRLISFGDCEGGNNGHFHYYGQVKRVLVGSATMIFALLPCWHCLQPF